MIECPPHGSQPVRRKVHEAPELPITDGTPEPSTPCFPRIPTRSTETRDTETYSVHWKHESKELK